jgi:transcriptional regulator with XRE-family HTH domain
MPALDIVTPTAARSAPLHVDRPVKRSKNWAMNEKQLAEFAINLRERREKLRLTRVALAARAGITRTTLRMLEKGVQHPEPETLEQLAKALHTTEHALTGQRMIEASDARLRSLTDEDIEVAQQFHHAPTRVKLRVLGELQEHGRQEHLGATANEWAQHMLTLTPEQRQAVALLIYLFAEPGRAVAILKARTALHVGESATPVAEPSTETVLQQLAVEAKAAARAIEREAEQQTRQKVGVRKPQIKKV